jgi:hypothetical protein
MKENRKLGLGIIVAVLIGVGTFFVVRAFDSAHAPENVALRNMLAGCDRIEIHKGLGTLTPTLIKTLRNAEATRFTGSIELINVGSFSTS